MQTNEQNWHTGGNFGAENGKKLMSVSFPYLNLTLTVLMDTGGTYSVFSDDLSHFSFTHTNMQVVSVSTQMFASISPLFPVQISHLLEE